MREVCFTSSRSWLHLPQITLNTGLPIEINHIGVLYIHLSTTPSAERQNDKGMTAVTGKQTPGFIFNNKPQQQNEGLRTGSAVVRRRSHK